MRAWPSATSTSRAPPRRPRGLGERATGLALDVTDAASFEAFLDAAEERLGRLDVLVNNAGIMWVGRFDEEPEAVALKQFDVNFHGVLRGMKLAVPRMRARGRGQIVNVASSASKIAPPGEATLLRHEARRVRLQRGRPRGAARAAACR